MGFAALPFDPRSACFCRQNCLSFRQPTSRWWVVYQSAPPTIPELATGVLVEFDSQTLPDRRCLWKAVTLPVDVTVMDLEFFPLPPVPGTQILKSTFLVTGVGDQNNLATATDQPCEDAFNLPEASGTLLIGACQLTPVRWFQNANDVPH